MKIKSLPDKLIVGKKEFNIGFFWMTVIRLLIVLGLACGLGESSGTWALIVYSILSFFLNDLVFIIFEKIHLTGGLHKIANILFLLFVFPLSAALILFGLAKSKSDISIQWIGLGICLLFMLLFFAIGILWMFEGSMDTRPVKAVKSDVSVNFSQWKWGARFWFLVGIAGVSWCLGFQLRQVIHIVRCSSTITICTNGNKNTCCDK